MSKTRSAEKRGKKDKKRGKNDTEQGETIGSCTILTTPHDPYLNSPFLLNKPKWTGWQQNHSANHKMSKEHFFSLLRTVCDTKPRYVI
jgi:hypothetical protein